MTERMKSWTVKLLKYEISVTTIRIKKSLVLANFLMEFNAALEEEASMSGFC